MHRLYFTLKFLGMQDKVYNNRFNWVLPRLATGFIRRFYLAQGQSLQAEGIKGGSLGKIQAKSGKVVKKMLGMIIRFIVSALVLMFVGFVVPPVGGFGGALVAWSSLRSGIFGGEIICRNALKPWYCWPSHRPCYLFNPIYRQRVRVTVVGALLSALVIGIIDAFVPTELRRGRMMLTLRRRTRRINIDLGRIRRSGHGSPGTGSEGQRNAWVQTRTEQRGDVLINWFGSDRRLGG